MGSRCSSWAGPASARCESEGNGGASSDLAKSVSAAALRLPRPEHLSSKEPERAAGYEIEPAETHIQPNGVPDDRRSEVMAGERDRHAPSYPPNRTRYRSVTKTPIIEGGIYVLGANSSSPHRRRRGCVSLNAGQHPQPQRDESVAFRVVPGGANSGCPCESTTGGGTSPERWRRRCRGSGFRLCLRAVNVARGRGPARVARGGRGCHHAWRDRAAETALF